MYRARVSLGNDDTSKVKHVPSLWTRFLGVNCHSLRPVELSYLLPLTRATFLKSLSLVRLCCGKKDATPGSAPCLPCDPLPTFASPCPLRCADASLPRGARALCSTPRDLCHAGPRPAFSSSLFPPLEIFILFQIKTECYVFCYCFFPHKKNNPHFASTSVEALPVVRTSPQDRGVFGASGPIFLYLYGLCPLAHCGARYRPSLWPNRIEPNHHRTTCPPTSFCSETCGDFRCHSRRELRALRGPRGPTRPPTRHLADSVSTCQVLRLVPDPPHLNSSLAGPPAFSRALLPRHPLAQTWPEFIT